ncbi:MAG TPA: pyridoxine 5'-phosphate synthase [Bacteroidia bacterium]|nr:pyridoxine 5'-phosphate synthase [Bacteroidia bacterium]HNT79717.1 pyridoxine 5'-phosphate synthase [Bacteroidia bacterium]
MTRLSVNINKIATLRNARGGSIPNVVEAAEKCQRFGAQGITVHPRPDGRHIRYDDVRAIKPTIRTEFNIEGYPDEQFLLLIEEVKPEQVTLVPDAPSVLTSNAGWDVIKNLSMLKEIVIRIKSLGSRVSLFIDANEQQIERAAQTGTDCIELYTESYAMAYSKGQKNHVVQFSKAALYASNCGLRVNAGHDLNLNNLAFFISKVKPLEEVSIGHALISDALYFGLQNTIQMYKGEINKGSEL